MEPFVAVAVIAVFMYILGFSATTIGLIGLAAAGLLFALFALLFVYFFIRMLLARRREARFSRIAKSPRSRFKVAYYIVEDREYPNVFPEEGFMEDKLYKNDKKYHVLLDFKRKYVYDRFAVTTCTIGFMFCAGLTSLAVVFLYHVM